MAGIEVPGKEVQPLQQMPEHQEGTHAEGVTVGTGRRSRPESSLGKRRGQELKAGCWSERVRMGLK